MADIFGNRANSMFDDKTFSDCEVACKDQTLFLHRAVLANHSIYFRKAFTAPMKEGAQKRIEFEDCWKPSIVKAGLECIYNNYYLIPDEFDNRPETFHTEVYVFGDYLQSDLVTETAVENISERHEPFSINDFTEAASIAFEYTPEHGCEDLRRCFMTTIAEIALRRTDWSIDNTTSRDAFYVSTKVPALAEHVFTSMRNRIDKLTKRLEEEKAARVNA